MKGKTQKSTKLGYNERHAKSGITAPLPNIETFPNQYKDYEITIEIPDVPGRPQFLIDVIRHEREMRRIIRENHDGDAA